MILPSIYLSIQENEGIIKKNFTEEKKLCISTHTDSLHVLLAELDQMAMETIHKQKPPDTVFAEIVRNAEKRNSSNEDLRNQNLKLEPLDLVLLAVRTVGELDTEKRSDDSDNEKGDRREREAQQRILAEAEDSKERLQLPKSCFYWSVSVAVAFDVAISVGVPWLLRRRIKERGSGRRFFGCLKNFHEKRGERGERTQKGRGQDRT